MLGLWHMNLAGGTHQFLVVDTKKLNYCWSRAQLSTSYYDFLPHPCTVLSLPLRIMERMEKYDSGWVILAHWLVNIKDSYKDQTRL